jgi:hypothetical protein
MAIASSSNEHSLAKYDFERAESLQNKLASISNLVLLDAHNSAQKLPVFSFLIRCGHRFLHYNYVCALLNDLFGIQSRGGCQCAGPYAQFLLGMTDNTNDAVEKWLLRTKDELMRPGATRLSLPLLGTTQEIEDYVLDAIRWVAKNGWKLLHMYRCNHRSGEWRHKSRPGAPLGTRDRLWLSHYHAFSDDAAQTSVVENFTKNYHNDISLAEAMANANKMLNHAMKDQSSISQALKMVEDNESESPLRWYVYPKVRIFFACAYFCVVSLYGLHLTLLFFLS